MVGPVDPRDGARAIMARNTSGEKEVGRKRRRFTVRIKTVKVVWWVVVTLRLRFSETEPNRTVGFWLTEILKTISKSNRIIFRFGFWLFSVFT